PSAGSSAAVRQPSGTSGAGVSPSTTTSSSVRSRRVASGMKAAYTAAPPMTHRSSGPTSPSASAGDATTVAPSSAPAVVESTRLRRPGSGRNRSGSDSQVRRPMTTVPPDVSARNRARSSGTCHGIVPSLPIQPSADSAQTSVTSPTATSDRDGGLDRRVVPVPDHLDVLERVLEQRRGLAQPQRRRRVRLARELLAHLLDVVVVDVAVPARPDQVAHVEVG